MSIDRAFEVTEQHLKLIKRMWIEWNDQAYDGAPAVDIKRPYGNSDVIWDIAEILDLCPENPDENCYDEGEWQGEWVHQNEEKLLTLHRETAMALQCCICAGKFESGKFVRDMYEWRPAESDSEFEKAQREQAKVEERKSHEQKRQQLERRRIELEQKNMELEVLRLKIKHLESEQ